MKDAVNTIEVTKVSPTYAWAVCGGGGKETDGGYCGNTVKFNPETMCYGKCAGCGVIWMLADDDATAESTFDPNVYSNVSMLEFAKSGRGKVRAI